MRRLAMVALLFVFVVACDAEAPPTAAPPGDDAAAPPRDDASAPPTAAQPGVPPALDFTVATVDGGQVRGPDLAGRHLALWFWAPW